MSSIYEQHDAAFSRVAAFVIVSNTGEKLATIAFKFPADGAGRLYCYLQVMGATMVRGSATGGGYDKKSAAAHSAAGKLAYGEHGDARHRATIDAFKTAIKDAGYDWQHDLREAGFTVLQAA